MKARKRLLINLEPEVHQAFKEKAVKEGRPMSAIIRELILRYLEK